MADNFSLTVKISVAIISVILMILFFVLGGQTAQNGVSENKEKISIHEVKVDQIEKEVDEVKLLIKENQVEIKQELKEQRIMIYDIHKAIMEDK